MEGMERNQRTDVETLSTDIADLASKRQYAQIEILLRQTEFSASMGDITAAFDKALDKLRDEHHFNNAQDEYRETYRMGERMRELYNGGRKDI